MTRKPRKWDWTGRLSKSNLRTLWGHLLKEVLSFDFGSLSSFRRVPTSRTSLVGVGLGSGGTTVQTRQDPVGASRCGLGVYTKTSPLVVDK